MSNRTELKNGDKCYVSDISMNIALSGATECFYVGRGEDGRHVIQTPDGQIFSWRYVIPVPEPELVPWDYSTCPLPPFTVKNKNSNNYVTITSMNERGCGAMTPTKLFGFIAFDQLLDHYDYFPDSQDRNNVKPCGVMK